MAKPSMNNLHKSMANMTNSTLVKDIKTRITDFGNQMRASLPSLLGHVDVAAHLKLGALKKKFLKNLDGKRKKFKLALESLGWGTLASFLEHAFNGEELNVIV